MKEMAIIKKERGQKGCNIGKLYLFYSIRPTKLKTQFLIYLKPNFDLLFSQLQFGREIGPFGNGQILFLLEFLFQCQQLLLRKWRPWLPIVFVPSKHTRGNGLQRDSMVFIFEGNFLLEI
jgi:hypothetical protein